MYITRTQKECKDFEIKNLGEYHDTYVQSYTLLQADLMYLRTSEISVLKQTNYLVLQNLLLLLD